MIRTSIVTRILQLKKVFQSKEGGSHQDLSSGNSFSLPYFSYLTSNDGIG